MAFRSSNGRPRQGQDSAERLGVAESVNAIKDRKIDAFFWSAACRPRRSPTLPARRA